MRIFRPLKDGFWPDVVGALGTLAGATIGAFVFDSFSMLWGAAVGVTIAVLISAVRRARRQRDPDPLN